MSTTLLVAILTTICIGADSSSELNLTVQPERLLVEQGRQKSFKVLFETDAPDSSCVLECDGKTVPAIKQAHLPGGKGLVTVVCSKLMTPRNVTQNCSVTASVIFNVNATYSNSINFTVEKELKVNRSAVYAQEGQDVELGQTHEPYEMPLTCTFTIPNDRYQQTGCNLMIQKTVADDVMEHPFNICLADSGDESCVSGSKSLNLFTPFLDTQSGNFSLTLKGKSAVDGLDVRCVRGCGSTNYSTLQNLTNKAIYSWEKAKYPIRIQIGNRMFDIDADSPGPEKNIGRIVGVSVGTIIAVIIAIGVPCYLYKRRQCCFRESALNGDEATELQKLNASTVTKHETTESQNDKEEEKVPSENGSC